nr:NAD(P)H-binding protein [Planosporangium thailandense]
MVTGGTGLLGRQVAVRLLAAGREVRVMSRRPRAAHDGGRYEWAIADLRSGRGVGEAVAGVDVIVHCATAFGRGAEVDVARTVVEAAQRADVPHLVYISIVGVDRVPLGYYRAKLAAERLIEHSGLPYTILRATQFHDLVRTMLAAAAKSPVMPVPDLSFQPVDVSEVATRLAELALGDPVAHAPDFAGPQVRAARELAGSYLRATGRRRPILPVRLPGMVFRAYRRGGNLAPEHAAGKITFEECLTRHADPTRVSYRGRLR